MRRFISAFLEAFVKFGRDGCAFLAQSVAFSALFAFFPLMFLGLAAATLVFPDPERRLLQAVDQVAPTLHDYVAENLHAYISGRGISSVIAFVTLIWSGKNLFTGLAYALDRALNVPKRRPLVHSVLVGLVMLPITGVLLIVAIALPIVLAVAFQIAGIHDPARITQILGYVISIALIYVVALLLYRMLPNRPVSWAFAARGAAIVAIPWPAVQYGFAVYATRVDFTHIYGALSAPIVLLLWFYFIGSIFLFGAEYSIALSTGYRSVFLEE